MGKRLDRSNVLVVGVGSEIVGRHRDNADHKCRIVNLLPGEVEVRHESTGRKSSMTRETLANRYMVAESPEKTLVFSVGETWAPAEPVQPQLADVVTPEPEAVDPDVVTAPGVSLVKAGDWNLYRQEKAEEETVRDIDIAKRAGLAKPRDIRQTIKQLVTDGLVELVPEGETIAANAGDGLTPRVYEVTVKVPIGSGATIDVTELHANQAAVAHIINRLRTPKAVELQKSIITAFLLLRQGRVEEAHKVATGQAPQAGSRADLELQLATLKQMVADGLIDSKTATAQQAIIVSKITGYDLTKAPQVTFERWSPVHEAVANVEPGKDVILSTAKDESGHYYASEIADEYAYVTNVQVGMMARALGIYKQQGYGQFVTVKINERPKDNGWMYNQKAKEILSPALKALDDRQSQGLFKEPIGQAVDAVAKMFSSQAAE